MDAPEAVSAATLDLDALLAPIADDAPAGVNLRDFQGQPQASALYLALKDARKAARDRERAHGVTADGASDTSIPDTRAEWRAVEEQAESILRERSKDLEVSAWLVEASTRLYGFAGLRDGFRLLHGLVSQYWDGCYPPLDEDGAEHRVALLTGLNGLDRDGTLIVPILSVPIVEGSGEEPMGTWRYQQAVAIQQTPDPAARQKRIDDGGMTLEQLEREGNETPHAFFVETNERLSQCLEAYAALTHELDERCGAQSPPSSRIRHALEECTRALHYLGKHALEGEPAEAGESAEPAGDSAASAASPAQAAAASGAMSREQALAELTRLADFFRRTEPHSPMSYAIEQVVRWGRMPLPDLLQELVDEDSARSQIFRLAGIRGRDQGE